MSWLSDIRHAVKLADHHVVDERRTALAVPDNGAGANYILVGTFVFGQRMISEMIGSERRHQPVRGGFGDGDIGEPIARSLPEGIVAKALAVGLDEDMYAIIAIG